MSRTIGVNVVACDAQSRRNVSIAQPTRSLVCLDVSVTSHTRFPATTSSGFLGTPNSSRIRETHSASTLSAAPWTLNCRNRTAIVIETPRATLRPALNLTSPRASRSNRPSLGVRCIQGRRLRERLTRNTSRHDTTHTHVMWPFRKWATGLIRRGNDTRDSAHCRSAFERFSARTCNRKLYVGSREDRRVTRYRKTRREKARKPSTLDTARWLNRVVDEGRATRKVSEPVRGVGITGKGAWRYTHAARMRNALLAPSLFFRLSSPSLSLPYTRSRIAHSLSVSRGCCYPQQYAAFLSIRPNTKTHGGSSVGSVRAFIAGHYFSGMLLTVTLRNDKLICSAGGQGGKVYPDEGLAYVFHRRRRLWGAEMRKVLDIAGTKIYIHIFWRNDFSSRFVSFAKIVNF